MNLFSEAFPQPTFSSCAVLTYRHTGDVRENHRETCELGSWTGKIPWMTGRQTAGIMPISSKNSTTVWRLNTKVQESLMIYPPPNTHTHTHTHTYRHVRYHTYIRTHTGTHVRYHTRILAYFIKSVVPISYI